MEVIRRGTVEIFREEELLERLKTGKALRVKLGVDPTAPDLHLGHTVVLRKLRQFQELGHQAVLIIGDFTALVGDPSGRSQTRPPLSSKEIESNARTYLEQVGKILDTSKLEIVRNSEWLSKLSFADVLKLSAKMTVARLLERDDFNQRYKKGNAIGLHEFLYPLMQAYDSVAVRADVELGGTDQTYNLLVGRDLQRDAGQRAQVCITTPILVGLDGSLKMSKSYANHIPLDDPPQEMFGKVMSIPDSLMRNYYELLTEIPLDEVDSFLGGHPKEAKERLAWEIVRFYCGEQEANEARKEFRRIFSDRQLPSDMPELELEKDAEVGILRLVVRAGGAGSNREARRLVEQGGVYLDGERVNNPTMLIKPKDGSVLRVGRRKFVRLRVKA